MKVYIIRHGQTNWNIIKKIQGQKDIELNETGIKQATDKISVFNEYNFDLIICSTLKRAKKTAEILNSEKKIPIIYTDSLRERQFGDLEGVISDFDEDPMYDINKNISEKNIEPVLDLYKRVSDLLNEIKEKYNDKKVLLVTHGGTSRAIEAYFKGCENGIMPPETLQNCEIREYEYID
jgi:broad specificity phosphatase PhoE